MQKILPPNTILIPDKATRVFKGEVFDIYQWPQTLFDGRTKTFEMARRPDTVQILLVQNEQIMLVNDTQPDQRTRLHVPHGKADESDDSWLSAAKRELREETGVVCEHWRLISVEQPLPRLEWFAPLYLAYGITEEHPQQLDPGGEQIEVLWKSFDDVRAFVLSETQNTMSYMMPLFSRVKTIKELMALPAFTGQEIDR